MHPRRTTAEATAAPAVVLAVSVVLGCAMLLGGCAPGGSTAGAVPAASDAATGTAPATAPPPTPAPTATVLPQTAPVPDIPRTDAALSAHPPQTSVAPVRVEVPSLGIDVTVAASGLDAAGALDLPADPGVASWYRYGPSPWSTAGAAVIAAHVDSLEYGLGSFARLTDAPSGTPVVVTAADGRMATFAVQSVVVADKTGIDWAQVFDRSGPLRLDLITCGGEFDYDTGHYLSNVIVTAVPAA
jgi:hypothetical protein